MNRPSRIRPRSTWGTLAGVLLVAGAGCASDMGLARMDVPDAAVGYARAADAAPVIRAQSPDAPNRRPMPGQTANRPPVYDKSLKLMTHEGSSAPMGAPVAGPVDPRMATDGPAYCPSGGCPPGYGQGGYGGGYCPTGACPPGYGMPGACHPGLGACRPGNSNTYTVRDPGCPVYPPGTAPGLGGPGTPGAMIQYPYYTTKGPDDFFHDEDGKY